jgi:hypothetical protein
MLWKVIFIVVYVKMEIYMTRHGKLHNNGMAWQWDGMTRHHKDMAMAWDD